MAHSMICARCAIPMVFTDKGPDHVYEDGIRSCAELFRCPSCDARVLRADAADGVVEEKSKTGDFLVRNKPLPDVRRDEAAANRRARINKAAGAISEQLEAAITESSFGFLMDLSQMFRNLIVSGTASAHVKMMTVRGRDVSKLLDELIKEDP